MPLVRCNFQPSLTPSLCLPRNPSHRWHQGTLTFCSRTLCSSWDSENQNKHTQKKFCFEMMSIFLDKHPDWATFFCIFLKGIPLMQVIQSTKTCRNSSHLKKKRGRGTRLRWLPFFGGIRSSENLRGPPRIATKREWRGGWFSQPSMYFAPKSTGFWSHKSWFPFQCGWAPTLWSFIIEKSFTPPKSSSSPAEKFPSQ